MNDSENHSSPPFIGTEVELTGLRGFHPLCFARMLRANLRFHWMLENVEDVKLPIAEQISQLIVSRASDSYLQIYQIDTYPSF
jgi:hypothetical protein